MPSVPASAWCRRGNQMIDENDRATIAQWTAAVLLVVVLEAHVVSRPIVFLCRPIRGFDFYIHCSGPHTGCFHVLLCHPWPCMLLSLRSLADSFRAHHLFSNLQTL
jgi:hypothetical protein